ncbi:serine protease spb1 [Bdellovibrio sp. SKB1291214]|uniref:serine protease spb1 n=1 Tax=Bdellovibrio sp. SKB1291214 TaxID=1732569 RepID=UPI000B6E6E11|nr:serine protease spb1 [Bdellovibrio sp. SKB1291214]UYL07775.1 serine protease spb1 [Bdellovibrio sp. SKB1291214]
MKNIALFVLIFSLQRETLAASCCGGGFAFPALIMGDDKAQITSSLSYGKVTDDVLPNQKWIKREDGNLSQTLKIEAATLLSDTFQSGISIPVVNRKVAHENSTGLGDVSLNLGHETLPELSYSPWKPKGVTFLQMTLPTSPSIYDSENILAADSRGRGFFTIGGGFALIKVFGKWDANSSVELHKSFARDFSSSAAGGTITATPHLGHSWTVGGGWNHGDWRWGTSFTGLYEDAIEISGAQKSSGSPQQNITWSVMANYMMGLENAWTLSYADQTLFGMPENSSLSKTVTLSFQTRWQR